jgi:hypothetical protein
MVCEQTIDRLIQLKRIIKNAKAEEDAIIKKIKQDYEIGEVLLGSEGRGYQLAGYPKKIYGAESLKCVPQALRLELMSLSTAKLEDWIKNKKISKLTLGKIQQNAINKIDVRVIDYIPENALDSTKIGASANA